MYLLNGTQLNEIIFKGGKLKFGKTVSFEKANIPYDQRAFETILFQPIKKTYGSKLYYLFDISGDFCKLCNNKTLKNAMIIDGIEFVFDVNGLDWWQFDPDYSSFCYSITDKKSLIDEVIADCNQQNVLENNKNELIKGFENLYDYMGKAYND